LSIILLFQFSNAQEDSDISWWNPADSNFLVVEGQVSVFSVKKLEIPDLHGTGCTLTSSITANLVKGISLYEAVELSKTWMARLLGENPILDRTGAPRSMDHLAVMAGSSLKE